MPEENANNAAEMPTRITIPDSNPLFVISRRGLVAAFRLQTVLWVLFAVIFVLLKIWDRSLTTEHASPWLRVVLSGLLGKLDDVSFLTAVSGLACSGLIASATLNLAAMNDDASCEIRVERQAVWAWLGLVAFGWAVYMAAIGLPHDEGEKGTFLSILPGNRRYAQVFEGIANLTLIAILYAYVVGGWLVQRRVNVQLQRLPLVAPKAKDTKVSLALQAGFQIANLPVVWLPAIVAALLAGQCVKGVLAYTFKVFNIAEINPDSYGFDPLSGLRSQIPALLLNFSLLYLPFAVLGIRGIFAAPGWKRWEWFISRQSLGKTFTQDFIVDHRGVSRRIRTPNIALFRWHYP